jgi:hypothetical protein
MNTRHVLTAFAVLCFGWFASGCEVDNCKRGQLGCIEGKPDDGECKFGLVARNGKCVEPGSNANGDNNGNTGNNGEDAGRPDGGDNGGGDGGNTGGDDACGGCEGTSICVEKSKECVDFCEAPDELPGAGTVPELISCGGEPDGKGGILDLTFDANCKARCQLDCRWREWFCGEPCDANYCENGGAGLLACQTDCPLLDLACMAEKCREAHGRKCDGAKCKDDKAPDCTGIQCSNECRAGATGNLFDGYCDDGSYTNSASDFCPYGTDCADCGPRREPARPEDRGDLDFGELCPNPWRCDDHTDDNTTNASWCLLVPGGVRGLARCMPDCSEEGEECPSGYGCFQIVEIVDGKEVPVTDRNGVSSKGCFPDDDKVCK